MKRIAGNKKTSLLLLMVVSFMTCIPAYATETSMGFINKDQNIVKPMFTNIAIFQNDFNITTGGKVELMSYLTARNVTEVAIETNLQQNKNGVWVTIKSWSSASKGTNSGLEGSYFVSTGYKYRMVSKGKVFKNGSLVEETSYISEIKSY